MAAGIAVYENPNVREWIEKNRQRLAERWYPADADAQRRHEPHSPETKRRQHAKEEAERTAAVDAARRKREEIMRVNGETLQRRHSARSHDGEITTRKTPSSSEKQEDGHTSFDDFLRDDGSGAYTLHSTGVELNQPIPGDGGELRQRADRHGLEGLQLGAAMANPFADEDGMDFPGPDHKAVDPVAEEPKPLPSPQPKEFLSQTPVSPAVLENDQAILNTPSTSASSSSSSSEISISPPVTSAQYAAHHLSEHLEDDEAEDLPSPSSAPHTPTARAAHPHPTFSPSVISLQSSHSSTATLNNDDDVSLISASEGEGQLLEEVDSEEEEDEGEGGVGTPIGSWSEIESVPSGRSRRSSWAGSSSSGS